MSKNEETYEETLQKEFEMSQSKDDGVVKDLGRVRDVTGSGTHKEYIDNDDMDRINDLVGFRNIPLTDLPSQGRYYPDNTKITIRAARVDEIHEFSSINEEDASDVIDKMTYIVSKCVKIYYGNVLGHYKDLINADRIVLILKIRELTFKEGLRGIKIPVPSDACSTSGCKPQDFIEFTSGMLTFYKPAPELEKYYDPENKCYNIQTKSYGTITLYITTIGVTQAISSWINYKYEHKEKFTETLANMMPFVIKDWRGLNDRVIFNTMTEMSGWSAEHFSLVYRLIEKITVGIEFEIKAKCASCGGELTVPLTFPDGYRSLLVPTVSDFGDELL